MSESNSRAEVIEVANLEKHPNADKLSILRIWGWTLVTGSEQWKEGAHGAFITPDTLVPVDRPEFAFLADGKFGKVYTIDERKYARIKVKKIRGVYSQGLLVPVSSDVPVGSDLWDTLELLRYDPSPENTTPVKNKNLLKDRSAYGKTPPGIVGLRYDLEAFNRYGEAVFKPGEIVVVTEKIHGANARFTYAEGRLWVGSRTTWKNEFIEVVDTPDVDLENPPDELPEATKRLVMNNNEWWRAARRYRDQLEHLLSGLPGWVLYGEVFGQVQDLKYDRDFVDFAAFDLFMPNGQYLSWEPFQALMDHFQIPRVPHLYSGPYKEATIRQLADGQSRLADHIREGCVIRPLVERCGGNVGRHVLKLVSNAYLER